MHLKYTQQAKFTNYENHEFGGRVIICIIVGPDFLKHYFLYWSHTASKIMKWFAYKALGTCFMHVIRDTWVSTEHFKIYTLKQSSKFSDVSW